MELRIDPLTGVQVQVTGSRQKRPNRPTGGCPFCVGGIEAPEPYDVKAFTNRWPSFPDDRCEVVLFSPDHDGELRTLPPAHVRKVVDLWAERTAALGARPDLAYVLVFENNGAEVGATIPHPHGQIYSYPDVPVLPATELARLAEGHPLLEDDRPELIVVERDGWRAWVPGAPIYPYGMRVAPLERRPDLPSLTGPERDAFGSVLTEALRRLAGVFDPPMPYMFWIHQRPFDGGDWPQAWLHVDIAGPHRAPGVMRYVAGAELGSGAYLNPVPPEDAAANLRAVDA
jgi:UDPglucose--hexose-1-phosphate uridylyltransferase